jgi:predicted transcriptional regulator
MKSFLTIPLDEQLERRLMQVSRVSGKSRSEIVLEALRRHFALIQFEEARQRVMPFAEAAGYFSDADVFRAVS